MSEKNSKMADGGRIDRIASIAVASESGAEDKPAEITHVALRRCVYGPYPDRGGAGFRRYRRHRRHRKVLFFVVLTLFVIARVTGCSVVRARHRVAAAMVLRDVRAEREDMRRGVWPQRGDNSLVL